MNNAMNGISQLESFKRRIYLDLLIMSGFVSDFTEYY